MRARILAAAVCSVLLAAATAVLVIALWKRGSSKTSHDSGQSPSTSPAPTTPAVASCLCIFDIDRTLTGKQGDLSQCSANLLVAGVKDTAYGGGTLTLSEMAQHLDNTFCAGCYIGTISAGDASGSGSRERNELHRRLSVEPGKLPTTAWSVGGCKKVTSPLVTSCADGEKQHAVPGIQAWFAKEADIRIADEDVYFFDDRSTNIEPFRGLPYNAHQIACVARDPSFSIGLCGATVEEITGDKSVALCGESNAARISS